MGLSQVRAYSIFHIKSVDEDARILEGIASTPEVDRAGDIVEPEGAQFSLPLPLLWQHRSDQPIGHVTHAKVTKDGIHIRAQIAKGVLPRIDEAWQLVKSGLVRGLSIGFKAIETAQIEQSFGIRFLKWEWLELSAVTIPANSGAAITTIKQLQAFDVAPPAASGVVVRLDSPSGVPGSMKARSSMKTIQEQIKEFEASRETKRARMAELMAKSAETGETLDAAQSEEYDTLKGEIEAINKHVARLNDLEEVNKATAKPVVVTTPENASAARDTAQPVIRVSQNLPPGYEFARMVLCKVASFMALQRGEPIPAVQFAKDRYPDNPRIQQYLMHKTAVAGGTTTDSVWAAPLLATAQTLESEFLEYLRPQTIVGKFGTGGIPSLRRVPFNVRIQSQSTAGSASWVGEGKPKPLTKFEYADTTLLFTKIAAIAVITEELARFSSPGAEGLVRDALADAVIAKMDTDFIDPAVSASSGVRPASITNGVTALSSAGTSADNARTDVQNLLETFVLANVNPSGVVLIMPNTLALALSNMFTTLAQPQFPGLNLNGGTLLGIPVITSQYAANQSSYGNMVIAVNTRDVALADDGRVNVDASREASIQMDDAPTQDATDGTGQTSVSMWQTNSIALRAEREIHWKKLRSSAVAFMDDVNWGSIGSPV